MCDRGRGRRHVNIGRGRALTASSARPLRQSGAFRRGRSRRFRRRRPGAVGCWPLPPRSGLVQTCPVYCHIGASGDVPIRLAVELGFLKGVLPLAEGNAVVHGTGRGRTEAQVWGCTTLQIPNHHVDCRFVVPFRLQNIRVVTSHGAVSGLFYHLDRHRTVGRSV